MSRPISQGSAVHEGLVVGSEGSARTQSGAVVDARRMLAGAGVLVDASDDDAQAGFEAFWVRSLTAQGMRRVDDQRVLVGYVNQGRWVADCPHCNSGIAVVTTGAPQGCCMDCGRHYAIMMPADIPKAVGLLSERPVANRNWRPENESVADLAAENDTKMEKAP